MYTSRNSIKSKHKIHKWKNYEKPEIFLEHMLAFIEMLLMPSGVGGKFPTF
jgi:hypothetical protein